MNFSPLDDVLVGEEIAVRFVPAIDEGEFGDVLVPFFLVMTFWNDIDELTLESFIARTNYVEINVLFSRGKVKVFFGNVEKLVEVNPYEIDRDRFPAVSF